MAKRRVDKNNANVSLNSDPGDASKALLGADADEELQMQDRLIEQKDHTIDGKAKRVTYNDLRESQKIVGETMSNDEEET